MRRVVEDYIDMFFEEVNKVNTFTMTYERTYQWDPNIQYTFKTEYESTYEDQRTGEETVNE